MKVKIFGQYIKLGQLIKKLNIIDTGGQAKYFVESHDIKVNGKTDLRRSTKIFIGSTVWIDDQVYYIIGQEESEQTEPDEE